MSFSASDKELYGNANHHVQIFYNKDTGKARIFYKYFVMGDYLFALNTKNAKKKESSLKLVTPEDLMKIENTRNFQEFSVKNSD